MNELALFAGAGGGILGGKLLGWRTVCAVEHDAYAASVLVARQNDGCLEPFPVWDDVRTFDGKPWRGIVGVVSGGFPCTDISAAGKGAGITGKQSGLWTEMARIVGEVRPRFVFVENSPLLVKRGLAVVLGDLAEMGYDARWGIVGAHHVGAPHRRHRAWIVGDSNGEGLEGLRHAQCAAVEAQPFSANFRATAWREDWRGAATRLCRVDAGLAHRVDRLKAIGNGQVPAVAALAWRLLGGPTG
jgi:DNA (cytosine-5)-methyltransferase 1